MAGYRNAAWTPGLALGVAVFLSFAATAGADTKVWANPAAGVYHCPGSPGYGAGAPGKFLSESEARGQGLRASDGQACGPQVAAKPTASARGTGTQRTRR